MSTRLSSLANASILAAASGCGSDSVTLTPWETAAPAADVASSGEVIPSDPDTSSPEAPAGFDSSNQATAQEADIACSGDTLFAASGERSAPSWSDGLRVCPPDPMSFALGYILTRQNHIDEFEGCESIHADLSIATYEGGLDLRPLRSLREVRGRLTIGSGYPHGFPSLEGLEGLRRVQGLSLHGVQVQDLTVFRNLEFMDGPPRRNCHEDGPSLEILEAENLVDLRGLENVRGIYSVRINASPAMRSLEGLHLEQDPEVCGGLQIIDSPIVDFGDLSSLTELGTLWLQQTPVSNLDAFPFRRMRFVHLERNLNLVDVGALSQLEFLMRLDVSGNPLLEAIPDMPRVCELSAVRLAANLALVHAPRFDRVSRLSELSVTGNPMLERLDGFSAVEQLGEGYISENASLTTLDLQSLVEVTGTLNVLHNPEFDASTLPNLPGRIKVTGNRDDPELLSPCPWTDDDECDEPPNSNLCAPGTDPICEEELE